VTANKQKTAATKRFIKHDWATRSTRAMLLWSASAATKMVELFRWNVSSEVDQ